MLELWGLLDVRFRREEPRPVRYRLTAARLEGNVLFGPPDAPDAGEEALYAETGWHFICRQREFFIYACDDPAAPELHTDPAVQALSLKMACGQRSTTGSAGSSPLPCRSQISAP